MTRYQVFFHWEKVIPPLVHAGNDQVLKGWLHSFFVDYDFKLPPKWTLQSGLRYNGFNAYQRHYLAPRIAIAYRPFDDHFSLKAEAGRHYQFVSQIIEPNQLGLGEQIWVLASSEQEFPVLQSDKFSLGARYSRRHWLIELEAYRQQVEGISTWNIRLEEPGPVSLTFGSSKQAGIDLLAKQKWKHYSLWLAYSLAKVEYHFPNLNAARFFPATYDRRHSFKWTNIFNFWKMGRQPELANSFGLALYGSRENKARKQYPSASPDVCHSIQSTQCRPPARLSPPEPGGQLPLLIGPKTPESQSRPGRSQSLRSPQSFGH